MITTIRQALHLMNQGQRFRWPVLVALSIVNSVLEVVSAALVYVLVGAVANPSGAIHVPLIGDIPGLTGDSRADAVMVTLIGIMIVFFLVRAVLTIGIEYVMGRVTANAAAVLSSKLARGYLTLPYSFHLLRNSSELIRNGHQAVLEVVGSVFAPLIRMAAEVVMAIGILILLVLVSPMGTVFAIVVVGGSTAILMFFVQPRVKRLGETAHAMHKDTLVSLQQSFEGVRDIKVLGKEEFFSEDYAKSRRRMARMSYLKLTLEQLPRLVIETSLVWFILIYLAYTVIRGVQGVETLSVLGLFGYAGLRLQPSLQRIVAGFNSIKFSTARTEDIHRDLCLIEECCPDEEEPAEALSFEHEIKVEDISFSYEGADFMALSDVDLTIRRGEHIGICGPTGGGKSTLIDLIAGLLSPSHGRVLVDGRDIAGSIRAWQRNLGVVSQMVFLVDDSLRRNIALGIPDAEIDEAALQEAVKLAQLESFVESLPEGLDTVAGERGVRISGGERQRIAIARALYRRPQVLIFDEGTSALDNVTEQELMSSLTHLRGTHTILLVAHRLSTVRDADRVIFVADGRIAGIDTFDELCDTNSSFRHMVSMI